MARRNFDLNRKLTGWASVLCLLGGLICLALGMEDEIITAGLIRNSLFLGALWLALPAKNRSAAWEDVSWSAGLLFMLAAVGFLAARFKWMAIPLVFGLALLIYFLRRPLK
ncbi:MAG: hypothetical protein HUJ26_07675 [Planctomycetaceae bacterium]|nr:hypothetical protein [Planctomycetaceae bacterium]